jgi:hypothetical protein
MPEHLNRVVAPIQSDEEAEHALARLTAWEALTEQERSPEIEDLIIEERGRLDAWTKASEQQ